jgi:hypothetical protein
MAFTSAEIWEIKRELGYNLLQTGATAYVGVSQLLETVVNENIDAEISTTATLATPISQASTPTPQTLTLADATSFSAGAIVGVDVDTRFERVAIQSKTGSDVVVQLKEAHSGTIPVALDGPIPLVREVLRKIREVKEEMGSTFGEGPLKKVDEIEWYEGNGTDTFGRLGDQLAYWRAELSAMLATPNLWERRAEGRRTVSIY